MTARRPVPCFTRWLRPLGLLLALSSGLLHAQTPDVAHRGETFDEYNTRRIAEEVRNHRNRNPNFDGPRPSEHADWGVFERMIARSRGENDVPSWTPPPRNTALEDYEAKRIASERNRIFEANQAAREEAAEAAFTSLLRTAHAGDTEALLEVGRRLSTDFYFPRNTKLDVSLAEAALSYFVRAYPSQDWSVVVNLIGLLPSLMEPQKYPVTESPGSVVVFQRPGVEERYSQEVFERLTKQRAARGEAFAALQLAEMMRGGAANGYGPTTQLPDPERRAEVRRLLDDVRAHCSYVGTFFIGAMILNFPDTDGEYLACLKSLLENPHNLPGDSADGYYTAFLRDEARKVLAMAHIRGSVPGGSEEVGLQLLRRCEGPLYRFHRYAVGDRIWSGHSRLSVLAAADDFEFVLKQNARVKLEEDPAFQPKDLPYRIALLRGIGHSQGDGTWEPTEESMAVLDVPAALRELKEAIAAAPDRNAAEEPTIRLLFLESRGGNVESAKRLLARTDGGLGAIARGLILATGVKGGIEPDLPRALDVLTEGMNGKDVRVRPGDARQVQRRLVLMLADHTELKDRVLDLYKRYFAAALFTHEEAKVIADDISLAAAGKTRSVFTPFRLPRPMTEDRVLKMDTAQRERLTAAALERLAKEAPPANRPRREEELRRDMRILGWLARAGHDPALQALREKAEKGETDAALEAFRSLMAHSPANAFLCVPLLERLQANMQSLLREEDWLPESAFPEASLLDPRSETFDTLLPLVVAEGPGQLPAGEWFYRETKEGPSRLRQLVGTAYRRNSELGELLILVTRWERTARQKGVRADSEAHRALLTALDEACRVEEPVPGMLSPAVIAALREVGEPADWHQASRKVTPYEKAQQAGALDLYREIRDRFFALNPADADPLVAALRESYMVSYCDNVGVDYRDPEAWRLLEPELATCGPRTALELANTLVMCSRANAPQATALLLRVQSGPSAPYAAKAARESLDEWGEFQDGVFQPGPLVRFLTEHAPARPKGGYFLDETYSREYPGGGAPLLDTELMKHLRSWSTKGDQTASELLAAEIATRAKNLEAR